jgi:hypothetical protein
MPVAMAGFLGMLLALRRIPVVARATGIAALLVARRDWCYQWRRAERRAVLAV